MIERICPKCRIPMNGERCSNPDCGSLTQMTSKIYWCDECNIPIFDMDCPLCTSKGRYIASDIRPVFPEENMLISLILTGDALHYQKSAAWYGNNNYIIDGKKVKYRFQP